MYIYTYTYTYIQMYVNTTNDNSNDKGNISKKGEGTVRGFAIESLHVLGSFKRGPVSAMHYLCV